MTASRRILLLVASALFIGLLAALILVVPMWAADSTKPAATTSTSQPAAAAPGLVLPLEHLDGKWTVDKNGVDFNATVVGDTIAIELASDGTSMDYWVGTFESTSNIGGTITSTATPTNGIVLSQDTTKDFQVGDGELTFTFEALNVKQTMVMHRA